MTSKEMLVGALNGVAVALTTAGAVYVWSRSLGLALVIGVSPAQSSSVILTTITDVVGFFSFLGIATLFSGRL